MSLKEWGPVLARISPARPENLDDILAKRDPRVAETPGSYRFPAKAARHMTDTPFAKASTIAFAARVTAETGDRVALASRLATLAAEKGAEPIILCHEEYAQLERFGFRVERVAGATEEERKAAEDQLIAFWNIILVI